MKKAKEKGKVIKLSDALKDTKEKKDEADQKKNMNKDEKAVDYGKRADVQEAVNVAADLLALQHGIILTQADATEASKEAGKPAASVTEEGVAAKKTTTR